MPGAFFLPARGFKLMTHGLWTCATQAPVLAQCRSRAGPNGATVRADAWQWGRWCLLVQVLPLLAAAQVQAARRALRGGDVVVFFSGHGVQLGGTNDLLPTDVGADSEEQVKDDGVWLSKLLADLRSRQPRVLLAIVDACRDNPLAARARRLAGAASPGRW